MATRYFCSCYNDYLNPTLYALHLNPKPPDLRDVTPLVYTRARTHTHTQRTQTRAPLVVTLAHILTLARIQDLTPQHVPPALRHALVGTYTRNTHNQTRPESQTPARPPLAQPADQSAGGRAGVGGKGVTQGALTVGGGNRDPGPQPPEADAPTVPRLTLVTGTTVALTVEPPPRPVIDDAPHSHTAPPLSSAPPPITPTSSLRAAGSAPPPAAPVPTSSGGPGTEARALSGLSDEPARGSARGGGGGGGGGRDRGEGGMFLTDLRKVSSNVCVVCVCVLCLLHGHLCVCDRSPCACLHCVRTLRAYIACLYSCTHQGGSF